ncbi:hypothetical protein [Comamonas thiooxydans]|uniref:hypothetical protein n=1 Tax=Comamonas thiooxydans TaxID=363952 RepID=UPI0006A879D1|nr:hypothetical protein [Comamonas thiooxydans]CUB01599.1 hypothetical protein Ga0061062_11614 [Comamonas thiooxydans]
MAIKRIRGIEIINDFDNSKENYTPSNFISFFEISNPISLRPLLEEYIKIQKLPNQEEVFEKFAYYYFIWNLSTEIILNLEKSRNSTIKRWWGKIDKNINPFKTKCILNKANFAYEKNLLTSSHSLSLKSTYFSLLFLCVKIQRAWSMTIAFHDAEFFEKFIRNEIFHEMIISEDLKKSTKHLFIRLLITSKRLSELSSKKKGIPVDDEIRKQRSSKANAARHSGRQELINEFKNLLIRIYLNLNTIPKNNNNDDLEDEKIKNFENLYDLLQLDFINLIEEYKKSAKQRNNNYGLEIKPENLDKKFKDWSKIDEDFRVAIDKLYNSDMPRKNNAPW